MTKKISIFIALAALVGGGAFLWTGGSEEGASQVPSSPATASALVSPMTGSSEEDRPLPPAVVAPVPELVTPGSRSEVQQAFGVLSERQLSDGRHFVQFRTADVRSLALYDSFEIRLDPATAPVTGRVEKVSEFEGMKRVSGKLLGTEGRGQDPFSMTVSSDGSYAVGNFALGGRSYSLESKNGAGWITDPDEGAKSLHRSDADIAH
jgi:hypothetical protein